MSKVTFEEGLKVIVTFRSEDVSIRLRRYRKPEISVEGILTKEESRWYFCNNFVTGNFCEDLHGYKFSYVLPPGRDSFDKDDTVFARSGYGILGIKLVKPKAKVCITINKKEKNENSEIYR